MRVVCEECGSSNTEWLGGSSGGRMVMTGARCLDCDFIDRFLAPAPKEPTTCRCWYCDTASRGSRYYFCATCGNKRCPHATHHDNPCTGSNDSGQPGSRYA